MVTRDEALEMAIDAAQAAHRSPAADHMRAMAMVSEAWIMIHDRLPLLDEHGPAVQAEHHPECKAGGMEHTGPCVDDLYPGVTTEGDERPVIATCGHFVPAILNAGRWLHPYTLNVCDDPPVRTGPGNE